MSANSTGHKAKAKKQDRNIPLKRDTVKALPVKKDSFFDSHNKPAQVAVATYVPEFPNRRARRAEKQAVRSGGNRKSNKARSVQQLDVMMKDGTIKGRPIMVRSGLIRRVLHNKVETRLMRFAATLRDKLFFKKSAAASKKAA